MCGCSLVDQRSEWQQRTVRDCALPLDRVPVLHERDDLADALGELGEDGLNRGLVLDDGRLAGLLSITDVLHALELRRLRRGQRVTARR